MSGPFLTPHDLNINLEEDSPNFTENDAASAVMTTCMHDFAEKMKDLAAKATKPLQAGLRRRDKILFCHVTGEGIEPTTFQIEWLKKL